MDTLRRYWGTAGVSCVHAAAVTAAAAVLVARSLWCSPSCLALSVGAVLLATLGWYQTQNRELVADCWGLRSSERPANRTCCAVVSQQPTKTPSPTAQQEAAAAETTSNGQYSFVARLLSLEGMAWESLAPVGTSSVSTRTITVGGKGKGKGKAVTSYRFELQHPSPIETVVSTLCSVEKWDAIDENIRCVTPSASTPGVFCIETHRIAVIAPRVAYVEFHQEERNGRQFVGFKGTTRPADHEPSSRVEAIVWIDGAILSPTEDGCKCIYFSVVDPSMWLPVPHAVATRIVQSRLSNVASLCSGGNPCTSTVSAQETLHALLLTHEAWRTNRHVDGITLWDGHSEEPYVLVRASTVVATHAAFACKLLSMPAMQYELLPWLSQSNSFQSAPDTGARCADEVWRLPSQWVGYTARKGRVNHGEPVHVEGDAVLAWWSPKRSDPSATEFALRPSGCVITPLGDRDCHIELILHLTYGCMPRNLKTVQSKLLLDVANVLRKIRLYSAKSPSRAGAGAGAGAGWPRNLPIYSVS